MLLIFNSLVLFVVLIIVVFLTRFYLMFLNKHHAARREALGKSAIVIDRSMMSVSERQASDDAGGVDNMDRAFDDETDRMNEDFIYVY